MAHLEVVEHTVARTCARAGTALGGGGLRLGGRQAGRYFVAHLVGLLRHVLEQAKDLGRVRCQAVELRLTR